MSEDRKTKTFPGNRGTDALLRALLCALLFAFFVMTGAQNATAALKPRQTNVSMDAATNPHPDGHDILLPMPCGGDMAFRAVGTQAQGFLDDFQTQFGCDTCERQNDDYYERQYSAAISGPFSRHDLPASWRNSLPKAEDGNYYFYLIGKYEITNFQWKAIMEGWCPTDDAPLQTDDARPKTGITWFDAVLFAKTYTEWLLQNAPDALPRFQGDSRNIGYLRLPTEGEWEYAARGGHAVPRSSLREQDFFPTEPGESLAQYAVYRSDTVAVETVQPIGSRKPNPLNIYDTAGNAAEMVLDAFRFSLGGRLHGSAGGFVRKGGSFFSSAAEILPGRREEAGFFMADGANQARDLGLRLVLSGINTPAGPRPAELRQEWKLAGYRPQLLLDKGKNPLQELDRLIAESSSPPEQENLTRLRGILKDNNIALERQQADAAESLIRSALFLVETIRNYGIRHKSFVNMIAGSLEERTNAEKMSSTVRTAVEQTIDELQQNRAGMESSLDAAIVFYRSKVEESLSYPEELFTAKLKLVGDEFKGNDILNRNMRQAHDLYSKHVALARQGRQTLLTRDFLLHDILPENLREGLPPREADMPE